MNFIGDLSRRITPADLLEAASIISVPVATIRGVIEVEAAGRGFDSRGRVKMLFEPHIFYRELGDTPARATAIAEGLAYRNWGAQPYPSTSVTWQRLERAMEINEAAALRSASFGMFQVMGFNHEDAGYSTARAMVRDYVENGEQAQLDSFIRLVDEWNIEDELQRRDAAAFARAYNGPAYARNGYDTKLLAAWRKFDAEGDGMPVDPPMPAPRPRPAPPVDPVEIDAEEDDGVPIAGREQGPLVKFKEWLATIAAGGGALGAIAAFLKELDPAVAAVLVGGVLLGGTALAIKFGSVILGRKRGTK